MAPGIYDGFEGFRTPAQTDVHDVLQNGVVALDANVLLDLYRYGESSRNEFLAVLERLQGRLFVPHQVITEFWRNRAKTLEDVGFSGARNDLEKARNAALQALARWGERARAEQEAATASAALGAAFDSAVLIVSEVAGSLDGQAAIVDTGADPVLERVTSLLADRVGAPYTKPEIEIIINEGRDRFDARIPPGYMDADKFGQDEQGTGDYILWRQLLDRAKELTSSLVFVTRDLKEDWWRSHGSHRALGPRVELVDEFAAEVGQRYLMLRPNELLEHAKTLFDVVVSAETINVAKRLSSSSSVSEGWTHESLNRLLSQLESAGGRVQAQVIREAAAASSRTISRDRVYDIGGYDADRQLKGFTRPVRGVVEDLINAGHVGPDVEQPLVAAYNGPGAAVGFTVPESVAASFLEVSDSSQREMGSELLALLHSAGAADGADQPTPLWALTERLRARHSSSAVRDLLSRLSRAVDTAAFPDWQSTDAGRREVRRALRRSLMLHHLHDDEELFEALFDYIAKST